MLHMKNETIYACGIVKITHARAHIYMHACLIFLGTCFNKGTSGIILFQLFYLLVFWLYLMQLVWRMDLPSMALLRN